LLLLLRLLRLLQLGLLLAAVVLLGCCVLLRRFAVLLGDPPMVSSARATLAATNTAEASLERLERRARAVLEDDILEAVTVRAQRPIPRQRLPTAQRAFDHVRWAFVFSPRCFFFTL
jgi:hypothetical protein